jgi:hypothetical protein
MGWGRVGWVEGGILLLGFGFNAFRARKTLLGWSGVVREMSNKIGGV